MHSGVQVVFCVLGLRRTFGCIHVVLFYFVNNDIGEGNVIAPLDASELRIEDALLLVAITDKGKLGHGLTFDGFECHLVVGFQGSDDLLLRGCRVIGVGGFQHSMQLFAVGASTVAKSPET